MHEPSAWTFAWNKHALETEAIFGRAVFDPLNGILRLAGLMMQQQQMGQDNTNMSLVDFDEAGGDGVSLSCAGTKNASARVRDDDDLQRNQRIASIVETLQARGGPATYSDSELALVLSAARRRSQPSSDRHSRIVKSGAYRLRYVLSMLAHGHELRRDLNFQEMFARRCADIVKVHPRRTWTKMLRAMALKQQQQQQRTQASAATVSSQNGNEIGAVDAVAGAGTGGDAGDGLAEVNTSSAAAETAAAGEAAPVPIDVEEEPPFLSQSSSPLRSPSPAALPQQHPSFPPPAPVPQETKPESQVRVFTFVDKDTWACLEAASASAAAAAATSSFVVAEPLITLDALHALRANTSLNSRLTASMILTIFGHLQADAPFPSSVPFSVIETTDCVDAEDDSLLSDLTGVFFSLPPPPPPTVTAAGAAAAAGAAPLSLSSAISGGNNNNNNSNNVSSSSSSKKKKVRLVELTLQLASGLIRSAVKPSERDAALALVGDFALRPLAHHFSPQQPEHIHFLMKNTRVGRSPPMSPMVGPTACSNKNRLVGVSGGSIRSSTIDDHSGRDDSVGYFPSLGASAAAATPATAATTRSHVVPAQTSSSSSTFSTAASSALSAPSPSPPSFLNARWAEQQLRQQDHGEGGSSALASAAAQKGESRQHVFPDEVASSCPPPPPSSSSSTQQPPQQRNIARDELSLQECLSALMAPRFFSGPELCGSHGVAVLVVDALRIYSLKLRG